MFIIVALIVFDGSLFGTCFLFSIVLVLFSIICCLSCFAIIIMGKRELAGLLSCDSQCSVALPHGAMGWSAVCDCGIVLLLFASIDKFLLLYVSLSVKLNCSVTQHWYTFGS